ncbi:MAG: exodeoxyribonuclease III [Planctomyces sp.]|jgi:exodeoxyribonuclease-3
MKLTTWNVNGLRAALRKGFLGYLEQIDPDVLLLQEVRAFPDQLPAEISSPAGWHVVWNPAVRPGYSGTAIWSKQPFEVRSTRLSARWPDDEGRLIEATVAGLDVVCVYLPSGSSSPERQQVKDVWLKRFRSWSDRRRTGTPLIFGGDINVAHTEKDIFHAKSNEQTSGFLPHEREWFGKLLKSGWHDLVREHHGDCHGPYSWWSNRGRARELDRGWRIDYLLCNAAARPYFRAATIHREAALDVSDHAPVTVELDWPGCSEVRAAAAGD